MSTVHSPLIRLMLTVVVVEPVKFKGSDLGCWSASTGDIVFSTLGESRFVSTGFRIQGTREVRCKASR